MNRKQERIRLPMLLHIDVFVLAQTLPPNPASGPLVSGVAAWGWFSFRVLSGWFRTYLPSPYLRETRLGGDFNVVLSTTTTNCITSTLQFAVQ